MNVEAVNDGLDDLLTKTVRANLTLSKPAEILDAGCGRMWTWDLANVPYRLTGVDSDEVALRLRVENVGDLDEWIVGDLRTVNMPPDRYDIVHCAYVLEHVEGAELVLDRLLDTLRPGGLMVLRVPDRDSVYGFIARVTPHRLHIAYKRYVRGRRLAGTPGRGPYPVVYDRVSANEALAIGRPVGACAS